MRPRSRVPFFCGANVRFGSQADICSAKRHVRFTPESGHVRCTSLCLLWAFAMHLCRSPPSPRNATEALLLDRLQHESLEIGVAHHAVIPGCVETNDFPGAVEI